MSDGVTSEQFPRGHSEQPLPTFCPVPRGVRKAKILMDGTEAVQTIEFFDGVGRKIGGVGNGGGSNHTVEVTFEEDETIVGLAIVEHQPEGSRHYAKNLIFRTLKVHGQPPAHDPFAMPDVGDAIGVAADGSVNLKPLVEPPKPPPPPPPAVGGDTMQFEAS
eukprot:1652793-Prymnesium_polylepis.1